MKYLQLLVLACSFVFVGCDQKSNEIVFWDGESIKEFEGKTMASMLWILPPPYEEGVNNRLENSKVFKRFDESDYEILLQCLNAPEIKTPVRQERLGRYLYLSFLDGTRYIIDFKDSYPFTENGEYTLILPNGQSKILYELIMNKKPCLAFESHPDMDWRGRAKNPDALME